MFRFTIRDVLWLTVVAALLVAFCVERSQRVAAVREIQKVRLEQARDKELAAYHAELQRAQAALLAVPNQVIGGN
jgi:hypothetical protein